MNPVKNELVKHLGAAIATAFGESPLSEQELIRCLEVPPNQALGHFAFPCFHLAKSLKQKPFDLATKLKSALEDTAGLERIEQKGPYLNFFLSPDSLGQTLVAPYLNGEYFKIKNPNAQRVMVEYSQPNTHKELHVGHMRNMCLGNALCKILAFDGNDVVAATYPGDVGTHVAKCLWYLKKNKALPAEGEDRGTWLGKMYATANNLLESELGTEKEESNRAELTEILKQLSSGSGEYFDLWKETREWSLELMRRAYDWADVHFDRWFFESEVDEPSVAYARELFEKGVLVEDDGAIGIDLSDDGLGFCLLLKSDGNGLYSTKDILLAKRKFEEFGVEKSIYVVDVRQSLHFKQVFKVLEILGFDQAKDCYHLAYDFVELPEGAMSSRKGTIVPLMDLIGQMQETIQNNYLSKYDDLSDGEKAEIARIIANGAIKYGMLKYDNNKKIVFDMNEWLKVEGDTGPYIQYAATRIQSIFKKVGEAHAEPDFSKLTAPQELALLLKLSSFNEVVHSCAEQLKATHLCAYLFELSKLFNGFYTACRISDEEDAGLKSARIELSKAVYTGLERGLALLGIAVPRKM